MNFGCCLILVLAVSVGAVCRAQPGPGAAPVATPDAATDAANDAAAAAEADERIPYIISIKGLEKSELLGKFKSLSLLQSGQKSKAESRGRLNARLAEDSATLTKLLRAEGYYLGTFDARVAPAPGPRGSVVVLLSVIRGPRFTFGTIRLTNFEQDGASQRLRNVGLAETLPARAQSVLDGDAELRVALPRAGYPFFDITARDVEVDYALQKVNVTFTVDPGPLATFGDIIFDAPDIVDQSQIARLARFKKGAVYNARSVDDFREALLGTSLFGTLTVRPEVDQSAPGVANIHVNGTPAKFKTVSVSAGYGTSEGAKVEALWTHRNLFRGQERLTILARAGAREQALRADLLKSNFRQRDQNLIGRISLANKNTDAFRSRSFDIGIGIERETQRLWQKRWVYAVSTEAQIAQVRDATTRTQTNFIFAVPANVRYDGTSDLFDPQRGFRASATLIPELSYASSLNAYVVSDVQLTWYRKLTLGAPVTLAARVRAGSITGAGLDNIALNRRFYAGGGGSVRGFNFQGVGPRSATNTPTGGRAIAELSFEARVKISETLGVVPFIDAGNVYEGLIPKFTGLRVGAGIGVRYFTSFAPIRIDIARAIGRRPVDPQFAVYVGIGQSF